MSRTVKSMLDCLTVQEHVSHSYGPRTYHNATAADVTVAFAVDFNSAGERLTRKAAEDRWVGIDINEWPANDAAWKLHKFARRMNVAPIMWGLNVAGNGIYTLHRKGWSQKQINMYVLNVIDQVHEILPLGQIVTGGQTGVDIAGAVAGCILNIETIVTMPAGFRQRSINNVDFCLSEEEIRQQIKDGVEETLPF